MPLYILIPLIVFQCVFCALYMETKHKKGFPRAVSSSFKALVTLSSAFAALCMAVNTAQMSAWLICWGLFLGAAADYTLNYRPAPGVALFSLGHICYIAAMCLMRAPEAINLYVTGAAIAADLIIYAVIRNAVNAGSAFRKPGFALLYALILCPLLGMAVTQKPVLLIAAGCFIISDILLAVRVTRNIQNKAYGYICLGTYYAAQLLFALSITL